MLDNLAYVSAAPFDGYMKLKRESTADLHLAKNFVVYASKQDFPSVVGIFSRVGTESLSAKADSVRPHAIRITFIPGGWHDGKPGAMAPGRLDVVL